MSLFKVRELWATECGVDETFDQHSLIVSSLNAPGDKIIVGSHSGCIRVYDPCSEAKGAAVLPSYKPIDLLLEMQLSSPILQVAVGRLVSGSYQQHLCILHPRSVAVYSLVTRTGEAEHGDQSYLAVAYEHQLRRSAACMVLGQFGRVKGRDFICVQSLDGTLTFFEQEIFVFHRFLPGFLLPGPLAFLPQTDSFITVSSGWQVESYRYQVVAEAAGAEDQDSITGKRLFPDWCYNLGESALSVEAISWSAADCHILVLGQRSLFCLKDSGALVFMKRLEYKPCCFHPYFVEPDGKMMILLVANTGTVLLYERTKLSWCGQLEWLPTVVCRAAFKSLQGVLVLLSDTGQLQCCYLGTQPSLFMPPPLEVSVVNYQHAAEQLKHLNQIIKEHTKADAILLADAATEREVGVLIRLRLSEGEPDVAPSQCSVCVELTPLVPLSSVQVSFIVQPPLAASPVSDTISSLCEQSTVVSDVRLRDAGCDVSSLEVRVVVSYVVGATGFPRVLQKLSQLPLRLVAAVCPATKEADFKITLSINQPAVTLAQLFPELVANGSLPSASTAVGFHVYGSPEMVVSILVAKSSQRYRLQTNWLPAACLFVAQLEHRLRTHFGKVASFVCTYASSLPMHQLFSAIDNHHMCRVAVQELQEELGRGAAQYRAVERRLLAKLKECSPAPLAGLDALLRETHSVVMRVTQQLQEASMALLRARCQLACMSSLVLLLLRLMDVPCHRDLQAALAFCPQHCGDKDWEEVSDAAITFLLRTSLAKSDKDKVPTFPITLEFTKDTSRFKKHISSAIDRLFKSMHVLRGEDASGELPQAISLIPEVEEFSERKDEEEVGVPVSSRFVEQKQSALPRSRSALQSAVRARTDFCMFMEEDTQLLERKSGYGDAGSEQDKNAREESSETNVGNESVLSTDENWDMW